MSYHEFSEQAAGAKKIDIEERMQGTTATIKQNMESGNDIFNSEGGTMRICTDCKQCDKYKILLSYREDTERMIEEQLKTVRDETKILERLVAYKKRLDKWYEEHSTAKSDNGDTPKTTENT